MRLLTLAPLVGAAALAVAVTFMTGPGPDATRGLSAPERAEGAPSTGPIGGPAGGPDGPKDPALIAPPHARERDSAATIGAGRRWSRRLAGRLVDRLSGTPVPIQAIALPGHDTTPPQLLHTDSAGFFQSRYEYPEGELVAELLPGLRRAPGDPPIRLPLTHSPALYVGGVPERRVDVGPTYKLSGFPVSASLGGLTLQLTPAQGGQNGPAVSAKIVHDGFGNWARFPPASAELRHYGSPYYLTVFVPALGQHGHATVNSLRGVHDVRLTLQESGQLSVSTRGSDGTVPTDCILRASSLDFPPGLQPDRRVGQQRAAMTIRDLRPGRYRIEVTAAGFRSESQLTLVEPGEIARVRLVLEPVVGRETLPVELISGTGSFHGPTAVELREVVLDDPELSIGSRSTTVSWSRVGDEWVGSCKFAELPRGMYELSARSSGRWERWTPGPWTGRASGEVCRLELADDAAGFDLYLSVLDAANDRPVANFDYALVVDADGRSRSVGGARAQAVSGNDPLDGARPAVAGLPDDARLSWRVGAEGYEDSHGDLRTLSAPFDHDGRPARVAIVRLAAKNAHER